MEGQICANFSRLGHREVPSSVGWDSGLVPASFGSLESQDDNSCGQIGRVLTYDFMAFFTWSIDALSLMDAGARFQIRIASLVDILFSRLVLPISIGLPFSAPFSGYFCLTCFLALLFVRSVQCAYYNKRYHSFVDL